MDGFAEKVRGVLSDTMNLPEDFLGMIPQYVAQNPVPTARTSGSRLATSPLVTSNVATAGTTFGTGADLLAAPLPFTADGKTSYLLRVTASFWTNTAIAQNALHINLDGADAGSFAFTDIPTAGNSYYLAAAGAIVLPASGTHTVNVRLTTNAGTATVGASATAPILVTLEIA